MDSTTSPSPRFSSFSIGLKFQHFISLGRRSSRLILNPKSRNLQSAAPSTAVESTSSTVCDSPSGLAAAKENRRVVQQTTYTPRTARKMRKVSSSTASGEYDEYGLFTPLSAQSQPGEDTSYSNILEYYCGSPRSDSGTESDYHSLESRPCGSGESKFTEQFESTLVHVVVTPELRIEKEMAQWDEEIKAEKKRKIVEQDMAIAQGLKSMGF